MRTLKRLTRVSALLVVTLLFLAVGGRELSRSRSFQLFGSLVDHVETSEAVVALTFDDGPTRQAIDELLPMLSMHGVRATFFVTGEELERDLDLGRRLWEAGHEVGNHTYSHQRMLLKSYQFVDSEIARTDDIIRSTGYSGPIHFRPPYGQKLLMLPLYLMRNGRTTVTWDIEPDSFPDVASDPNSIAQHVAERVRPGSIILLHPMYRSRASSLAAVPLVIEQLKAKGFRFVTVSELIADATRQSDGADS